MTGGDETTDEEFERLLDASSLGTPGAKALRALTPQEHVDRVLERLRELDREGVPVDDVVPPSPEMLASIQAQLALDEQAALEHPEQFG
jgi:hypothetical protein